MRFQAPRGTNDILPGESRQWIALETAFRAHASLYGYEEIRTPMFEDYEVFVRSAGETSDVVSKEMYDFYDKGERHVSLKPEETAPAMRAVIERNLCPPGTTLRLSYVTPIFRYDRPQKGRYRQAHQVGLELIGSPSVGADAEIIEATIRFYEKLGIPARANLNSLGREECRQKFREALLAYAEPKIAPLGEDLLIKTRKNPLRLLDSKSPEIQAIMKDAPNVSEFLEPECKDRFKQLQDLLGEAGVSFAVDTEIVRGLDYYTETVFEVLTDKLGAQSALCGGGRYDNLAKDLGGSATPSVGVAMGIERALLVLEELGSAKPTPSIDVYLARASEDAAARVRGLSRELRDTGLSVVTDLEGRSLKSQLGQADRLGARFAVVLGGDEVGKCTAQLRALATGEQVEVPQGDLVEEIKKRSS